MVQMLCDPAMQVKHWALLLQGLNVIPDTNNRVSLAELLRNGVLECPKLVESVWRMASEEQALLQQLEDLEGAWDDVEIHVTVRTYPRFLRLMGPS
eukprot:2631424-Pyramimonas_sp.AAC.1